VAEPPLYSTIKLPESVDPTFFEHRTLSEVSSKFAVLLSDPRRSILAFADDVHEALVQEIPLVVKHGITKSSQEFEIW